MTAVTERTLRYYDHKGLLKPSSRNEQGHRYYTDKDLIQLQKILTLKYLDFSLDDISAYLQNPEEDLQHSLAAQYEMLQQKQQKLERVLETITRMQQIVEGAGKVDSNLLLLFIHNIQHEEHQKQYLAKQIPTSLVDAIFMEGMSAEKRLELERQLNVIVIQLKEHYKQGRQPLDTEVLDSGRQLLDFLEGLIGPILKELTDQELTQLEVLDDSSTPFDPVLFPHAFTKDEEAFLTVMFEHLESIKKANEEGNSHEQQG